MTPISIKVILSSYLKIISGTGCGRFVTHSCAIQLLLLISVAKLREDTFLFTEVAIPLVVLGWG